MKLNGYYFGTITNVYEPKDKINSSGYQYQYQVLITADEYAQLPCRCIRGDIFGTNDDFEDVVLEVGAKVMVMFPRGDSSLGIIQGGTRHYPAGQNASLGKHWRNRFNSIVRYIDKDGNYSVTSDSGPSFKLTKNTVELNDSVGEKIVLDKASKTITIDAKDLKINIKNAMSVTVSGDVTLNCKNVDVTASNNATITAKEINLNGDMGEVLTTKTMPLVDNITGQPSIGVRNVKAGGPF